MASQLTYSNLFSESRNNVVALVTSSNVSDPTISSAEFRKWVYSREPDIKSIESKGYPYIIVHPADTDIDSEGGSLDGKSKNVSWDIEVEIVTSDRGYGENDGKGLTHMDSISNSLVETFMDKTNRNTLSSNSMKYSNCTTTSVNTEIIANELVYRRSLMLSFKSRIQISS